MSEVLAKYSTEIEKLSSILLSSLDESVFFPELGKFFHKTIAADQTLVYLIKEDQSARLIAKNGRFVKKETILEKGDGVTGHVVRTKSPYFSNNITRDPLFADSKDSGIARELVIPVSHEGVVIATLHFQCKEENEKTFTSDDMTTVLELISLLKAPLSNMRMYLSAKNLNEALIKQIEVKEKEIELREKKVLPGGSFKIEEKEIVAYSDVMKSIVAIADKVALTAANALIVGERGVGKELIAKRIHCRSNKSEESFISLDCSTLDEAALEKEIFGEEVGQFSELKTRNGLLEMANRGTLFLNNIEKLSQRLQSKLNSFLTEQLAFRVGGHMPYRSEVRIIGASTIRLEEEVRDGRFREDFFFNLNSMSLCVPSLRERYEDVEVLANYFLNGYRSVDEYKSFSPGVVSALRDYHWPGNVRELQNVVERAYILSDGVIIEKDHLADSITETRQAEASQEVAVAFSEMTLNELEKKHICLTLEHLGGNKTKTAKTLGITVKTLYNKLHSYGMVKPQEA
jgi:Nif-specific regulatory protein